MFIFSKAFSQLFYRISQLSSRVDKHPIQDQPSFQARHDPSKSRHQSGIRFDSAVCEDWIIFPVEKKLPILSLPIEIIQEITSYLPRESAAAFCLSSRYICYAVGTDHLYKLLKQARSKYERRTNTIILEQAFPSHWFCAWCDKFHSHDRLGGPTRFKRETKRKCAEFNSYIHYGHRYVLAYHHVRLAINQHLWGLDYGIPLDDFDFESIDTVKILKKNCSIRLRAEARIISNQFLFHAHCSIAVSTGMRSHSDFAAQIVGAMPQLVVGHRGSSNGHLDLRETIKYTLKNGHRKSKLCYCGQCSTDYDVTVDYKDIPQLLAEPSLPANAANSISPVTYLNAVLEEEDPLRSAGSCSPPSNSDIFELSIEVWRNLGDGRTPFETLWRAHGEKGNRHKDYTSHALDLMKKELAFRAGEIKEAFQTEGVTGRFGRFGTNAMDASAQVLLESVGIT